MTPIAYIRIVLTVFACLPLFSQAAPIATYVDDFDHTQANSQFEFIYLSGSSTSTNQFSNGEFNFDSRTQVLAGKVGTAAIAYADNGAWEVSISGDRDVAFHLKYSGSAGTNLSSFTFQFDVAENFDNSILVSLMDGNGATQSRSFDTLSGLTHVSLDFDQQFSSINLFDVRSLAFSVDSVAASGVGNEVFTLREFTYTKDASNSISEPSTALLFLFSMGGYLFRSRNLKS